MGSAGKSTFFPPFNGRPGKKCYLLEVIQCWKNVKNIIYCELKIFLYDFLTYFLCMIKPVFLYKLLNILTTNGLFYISVPNVYKLVISILRLHGDTS